MYLGETLGGTSLGAEEDGDAVGAVVEVVVLGVQLEGRGARGVEGLGGGGGAAPEEEEEAAEEEGGGGGEEREQVVPGGEGVGSLEREQREE